MPYLTIEPLGERALLLRWPQQIDAVINAEVHACVSHLRASAPDWIEDIVPAYASLAVVLDPVQSLASRITCSEARAWVQRALASLPSGDGPIPTTTARLVEIRVDYGGDAGPDLAAVADHCGLTEAEVIRRHTDVEYRVAMLGFSPGFPYLLGMDPGLAMPRREQPRRNVPAGSVGIGGEQTGIYPQAGPGGWQLIGRTPLSLFDARREPASLLLPGDRVRFVATRRSP